jgi:hypothetical protein
MMASQIPLHKKQARGEPMDRPSLFQRGPPYTRGSQPLAYSRLQKFMAALSTRKELKNLFLPTDHLDEVLAELQGQLDRLKERPSAEVFRLQAQTLDKLRGTLRALGFSRASILKSFMLESILLSLDVELVTARSGREALRRLLERDFAVILLDVRMPGMDGFETAAAGDGLFLCVTGQPGLGKTMLVEQFLDELTATSPACCVASGSRGSWYCSSALSLGRGVQLYQRRLAKSACSSWRCGLWEYGSPPLCRAISVRTSFKCYDLQVHLTYSENLEKSYISLLT